MSYLVLARKWRPQNFDEVVGQVHVTKTLKNAIEMDRVAHAFLFSGVRGVGKTSLARILAKALNCEKGPTANPCGECDSCKAVTSGTAVDVIEIDGASNNSVEDVRNLRETIPFRPVLGKFKIYVIDEVHMLSTSAFNALLKTLEEPPPHVKFIFATTESHKIPVTILSRCQSYDFRRIPTVAIVDRLTKILESENIAFEGSALALIGREAEGSMRDALSILDQVLAAGSHSITAELVAELLGVVERQVFYDVSRAVLARDPRGCLEIVSEVDARGYDITTFSKGLLEHLRNLVVAAHCQGGDGVLDLPDEEAKDLAEQAKQVTADTLHRFFKHFSEAYESIAVSSHPKILLETTLARVASLGELVPASELLERLERLAKQVALGGGGGGPSGPTQTRPTTNPAPRTSQSTMGQGRTVQAPKVVETPSPQITNRVDDRPASLASQPKQPEPPNVEEPPDIPETLTPETTALTEADLAQFVTELKGESPAVASFLEYGSPSLEGGRLNIAFNKEYERIAAMAKDRAPEIEAFLLNRFARQVSVSVTVNDAAAMPNATRQRIQEEDVIRRRRDMAVQHPLVRQIQSELQAKVSNIQLVESDQ